MADWRKVVFWGVVVLILFLEAYIAFRDLHAERYAKICTETVNGCPEYTCTCNMTGNQSLCDAVFHTCYEQARKLPPGEPFCINYTEVKRNYSWWRGYYD
jgi:hypothetical protein